MHRFQLGPSSDGWAPAISIHAVNLRFDASHMVTVPDPPGASCCHCHGPKARGCLLLPGLPWGWPQMSHLVMHCATTPTKVLPGAEARAPPCHTAATTLSWAPNVHATSVTGVGWFTIGTCRWWTLVETLVEGALGLLFGCVLFVSVLGVFFVGNTCFA